MIIGISGPSCSGKTSLAKALAELLDAPMLHLDHHFIEDATRTMVKGFPSFEQPHQYDAEALGNDLYAASKLNDHVVVEGFLLLTYQTLFDRCDKRVHLDVPHEVLAERRAQRHGATGDVKGGRIKLADTAWAAHGREEWERFGAYQSTMEGVEVLRPYDEDVKPSARELANRLVAAWDIRIG